LPDLLCRLSVAKLPLGNDRENFLLNFAHDFTPASASTLGTVVDLSTRAVEDAGLLEILQSPGPAVGLWGLFDPLLELTSAEFRFAEPLGQSREVKTALSGLFGRFVARAYATRYLGLTHFSHVTAPPMRLSGPMRGELRRVPSQRGDMPDWVAWGSLPGMAIVEAKGCHDRSGPGKTLQRAFAQAERAEIWGRQALAPFKRYAIATRWGFAAPLNWPPMLWVRDPEEKGDNVSPEEIHELQAGVIRLHYASLLDRLEQRALANALRDLVRTPFQNRHAEARNRAVAALDAASSRRIVGSLSVEPQDELIGGFVTRSGILPADGLSELDQETLSRLKMRPAFIGVERRILKLAVLGDVSSIKDHHPVTSLSSEKGAPQGPRDDGAGGWIVRLDDDSAQIE
jgi:hypothetical protein